MNRYQLKRNAMLRGLPVNQNKRRDRRLSLVLPVMLSLWAVYAAWYYMPRDAVNLQMSMELRVK